MKKKLLPTKISIGIIFVFLFFSFTGMSMKSKTKTNKSCVYVKKNQTGTWQLFVNGKPYFVKGVVCNTYKVGEDPGLSTMRDWMYMDDNQNGLCDGPYDAFVDKNCNNKQDFGEDSVGDFRLLQKIGCNTIRIYQHASNTKEMKKLYVHPTLELLYDHEPNKTLLRDLYYRYGIMTIMGNFMGSSAFGSGTDWKTGTDYRDPVQRAKMMSSVKQMVLDFKDEPFLLMYCLGNENDLPIDISHCNAGQYMEVYTNCNSKFDNQGHTFGSQLDPIEKEALTAYLATL